MDAVLSIAAFAAGFDEAAEGLDAVAEGLDAVAEGLDAVAAPFDVLVLAGVALDLAFAAGVDFAADLVAVFAFVAVLAFAFVAGFEAGFGAGFEAAFVAGLAVDVGFAASVLALAVSADLDEVFPLSEALVSEELSDLAGVAEAAGLVETAGLVDDASVPFEAALLAVPPDGPLEAGLESDLAPFVTAAVAALIAGFCGVCCNALVLEVLDEAAVVSAMGDSSETVTICVLTRICP